MTEFKIISIVLIFIYNISSFAQEENKSSYWVDVGIGVNYFKFSDSNTGLNIGGSLNYRNQNNNFSFKYFEIGEFTLSSNRPIEYIRSYELLYGRSVDFKMRGLLIPFWPLILINRQFDYSFVAKIGVSYSEGITRTTLLRHDEWNNYFNSSYKSGLGIPIEFELREKFTNYFAMGMAIYGNINQVKNYTGINLSLIVGRL